MRDNKGNRRPERPGEDGHDESLDSLSSSYTPEHRSTVLKGLRILARVAIRSYMEEQAARSQAGGDGEEEGPIESEGERGVED